MSLERWHPLNELEAMRREMDRIWRDVFTPRRPAPDVYIKRGEGAEGAAIPPVDIIDREKEILVKAEMPGVKKEDVSVSLEDSTLSIRGEVKEKKEEEGQRYAYAERKHRTFMRSINLPVKVAHDRITAAIRDGLLYVHLPKLEEEQTRKIKIDIS